MPIGKDLPPLLVAIVSTPASPHSSGSPTPLPIDLSELPPMQIPLEQVIHIAVRVQRGDVSTSQGMQDFVALVIGRDVPHAVLELLATDDLLTARFEAMFERLSRRRAS